MNALDGLDGFGLGDHEVVVAGGSLVRVLSVDDDGGEAARDQGFGHIDVTDHDGAASLLGELVVGRLDVVHDDLDVVANQFLSQELASLEHVGDVVQGAEIGRSGCVISQPKQNKQFTEPFLLYYLL